MYLLKDHAAITWEGLPYSLDVVRQGLEEVAEKMARDIQDFEKKVFAEQDPKRLSWMQQKLTEQKDRFKTIYFAAKFLPRANELICDSAVKLDYFRDYSWNAFFLQAALHDSLEAEKSSHQSMIDLSLNLIDDLIAKKTAA